MKDMTFDEAVRDLSRVFQEARVEPVRVASADGPAGVVISPAAFEEYERLRRKEAGERLAATMDRMAEEARAAGLTDEILAELLADES